MSPLFGASVKRELTVFQFKLQPKELTGIVLLSFYGAELIVITTYGNSWPIIIMLSLFMAKDEDGETWQWTKFHIMCTLVLTNIH